MSEETIENKVAKSGIINIDLADYLPKEEILGFDIQPLLWQGLALKEKDFREHLKNHNWSQYQDKFVAVYCSEEVILQSWAFMLIGAQLEGIAKEVFCAKPAEVKQTLLLRNLENLSTEEFSDERIIVKGCGDHPIDNAAYLTITMRLKPVAKSIMFGEACSAVPVYKKPRK